MDECSRIIHLEWGHCSTLCGHHHPPNTRLSVMQPLRMSTVVLHSPHPRKTHWKTFVAPTLFFLDGCRVVTGHPGMMLIFKIDFLRT